MIIDPVDAKLIVSRGRRVALARRERRRGINRVAASLRLSLGEVLMINGEEIERKQRLVEDPLSHSHSRAAGVDNTFSVTGGWQD
jgi:hypothetical protein